MLEDPIHNHVENSGREQAPQGHLAKYLERCAIVYLGTDNHSKSTPVLTEGADGTRSHTIGHEDVKAAVAVQGAIGLMKI